MTTPENDDHPPATGGRPRKAVRALRSPGWAALAVAVALGGSAVGLAATAGGSSGSGTGAAVAQPAAVVQPVAVTQSSSTNAAESVYRNAAEGVVEVVSTGVSSGESQDQNPFGIPSPGQGGGETQALGSGFVLDTQGHIVTNYHVVQGASSVTVKLADGKTLDARIVGSDPSTDIAVLQIDASSEDLHPLQLGDSGALVVGEDVYAIGNPYGLDRSLSAGVVSALDRQVSSPNGFSIDDAIQTDAAINHGNSGGPLLNAQAQVVGVTEQIESDSGDNSGVGFAIPSNTIRDVARQLIQSGSAKHAYLGVQMESLTSELAQQLGLSRTSGALVTQVVPGSPAASAGLQGGEQGGDVIVAAGGQPVTSADDLSRIVATKQPGDTLDLQVARGGSTRTVTVTLGNRPASLSS